MIVCHVFYTINLMKRFFVVALIFVLAGAGVVWGVDYYQYVQSPEYQAELKMQELEALANAIQSAPSTPSASR